MKVLARLLTVQIACLMIGCGSKSASPSSADYGEQPQAPATAIVDTDKYAVVDLTADLSGYSNDQKQMLRLLIQASEVMDELFWLQSYGPNDELLNGINNDALQRFTQINYGPWDRLDADIPFLPGVGNKPLGAQFYPSDMSKQEFEDADLPGKDGLYSLVRRDDDGELVLLPYHEVFSDKLLLAANLLQEAAPLARDEQFANYLQLRAAALLTDEYQVSDFAWMDMKDNTIELVIGPIETYEDRLFGYRAAFESYVLLKDMEWSTRLEKFAQFLPELQAGLPVDEAYRSETPGTDSDLNAYDVIYYAGHSNAGSKTIAINLPNDEQVQLRKGTRRLQLKNAMRAKFDKILVPISEELIEPSQRKHITFDAFFSNTMFHEVAHGLGIKNTIDGQSTVRAALKELASPHEEGKADVLGLYMVSELRKKGEIENGELMDNYVTFLASIFRSVRFGASSAHGRANMVRFNFFRKQDAFYRDPETGHYEVDPEKMAEAVAELSRRILVLQGDGDYPGTAALFEELGVVTPQLQSDLDRLSEAKIPVDIVFNQGVEVLGL
ncbi:MAG: Zn-dependent hydrolase [Pseudomonadota bacterium]